VINHTIAVLTLCILKVKLRIIFILTFVIIISELILKLMHKNVYHILFCVLFKQKCKTVSHTRSKQAKTNVNCHFHTLFCILVPVFVIQFSLHVQLITMFYFWIYELSYLSLFVIRAALLVCRTLDFNSFLLIDF